MCGYEYNKTEVTGYIEVTAVAVIFDLMTFSNLFCALFPTNSVSDATDTHSLCVSFLNFSKQISHHNPPPTAQI